jgi:hypothetical protein
MRPRDRRESGEQDLFRSRLDQVINMDHALVKLARTIDWGFLEEKFGAVYADGCGLSLSETQSCWQLISNRAMLLPYARGL